jgi:hypothetical protein
MGIDVSSWRARIGAFHASRGSWRGCVSTSVDHRINVLFLTILAVVAVACMESAVLGGVVAWREKISLATQVLPASCLQACLVTGGVETNPGPDHLQVDGQTFARKHVGGGGACLYRSISFCLTGVELRYSDIIHDAVEVFKILPALFNTCVDRARPGRANVAEYETFMANCLAKLQRGMTLPPDDYQAFWGEDGHVLAVALLYDIRVYVYNGSMWQAYNPTGPR